jgi:hypothetical protein
MASYQVQTPFTGADGHAIQAIRQGASQNVAYNAAGGASVQSTVLAAKTVCVMISVHIGSTGTGVRIAMGVNPVATSNSTLLPGSGTWFWDIAPGWLIAAISDDGNAGSINITEAVSR